MPTHCRSSSKCWHVGLSWSSCPLTLPSLVPCSWSASSSSVLCNVGHHNYKNIYVMCYSHLCYNMSSHNRIYIIRRSKVKLVIIEQPQNCNCVKSNSEVTNLAMERDQVLIRDVCRLIYIHQWIYNNGVCVGRQGRAYKVLTNVFSFIKVKFSHFNALLLLESPWSCSVAMFRSFFELFQH